MPVHRHLTIWGIIVVAGLLFAGEIVRDASFSMSYGLIPARFTSAAKALIEGHFSWESAKAFSTVVTSIFLHGDEKHILYNMVFLWTFGVLVSEILGQWRALAVFLATGVCGGVFHIVLDPASVTSMIGASGAIAGLVGTYLGLALRWQLPDAAVWPLAYPVSSMNLGLFGVVGFLGDLVLFANHDQRIAYGAHLGGFLSGLLIAAVITTIYPTLYKYDRASRKDCH